MAKAKAPLLSLGAHGSIAKTLTFQKKGSQTIVRKRPVPTDRKTLPQIYHRWDYQDYAALWHYLTDNEKEEWETNARPLHITGFNYWMSTRLNTLPDIGGRWRFDEVSGAAAQDSSKNQNTGTICGAQHVPGIIGHAISLDGIDDHFKGTTDPTLDLGTDDFTILFRFKGDAADSWCSILIKGNHAYSAITAGFIITIRTDIAFDQLHFTHSAPGNNVFWNNEGLKFQDNIWHSWAFVGRRSDGTLQLFRDGLSRGIRNPGNFTTDISSTYPLRFATNRGATGHWTKGILDELDIRHRAFTQEEVTRFAERKYPP